MVAAHPVVEPSSRQYAEGLEDRTAVGCEGRGWGAEEEEEEPQATVCGVEQSVGASAVEGEEVATCVEEAATDVGEPLSNGWLAAHAQASTADYCAGRSDDEAEIRSEMCSEMLPEMYADRHSDGLSERIHAHAQAPTADYGAQSGTEQGGEAAESGMRASAGNEQRRIL